LAASFDEQRIDRIIVKPVIGANADDTFLLHRDDPSNWCESLDTFANSPLMLQPFVDSVIETGEYSLFYFGNQYSHAVIKNPKQGDFRVQEEHGGTVQSVEPSTTMLKTGNQIMSTIGSTLLYARVDLVLLPNNSPALIELELIEPTLHFTCDPESASRFANTLDAMASPINPG
jgi:glutathione synthase/RimK-type ligase-like ATP-grasp enzyme